MRIAVNYDINDGSVWQHFGRTEFFKVYDVRDGLVTQSFVQETDGRGHGELVEVLNEIGADLVICGGLGSGLVEMIESNGMKLIPGVEGNADEIVDSFLRGELLGNVEAVHEGCHHHDEFGEEVDEEASCGCGGGCGSCGGGCGGCGGGFSGYTMEGENVGKTMRVHYEGTFNNGEVFDSSYDRGEPLEFVCGTGMMINGFDKAVKDMKVGETAMIHLMPEEAYGMPNPDAIFTLNISELPGSEEMEVGQQAYLTNQFGQPIPVTVTAMDETTITLDANHEMAGKELNFKIEIVEIRG